MFLNNYMILLLFALGSSVTALPTIQIKNGSQILEIADTPSIIEIIEPKTEPAMERELFILEIIEKPCKNGAEKAKACKEDGPDLDQSIRPFTNSHGYQFVVYGPKNEDDSDDENSKEEKDRKSHSNESKKDSDEDKYESKKEEEKDKKDNIGAQKDSKENQKEDTDNKNSEIVDDKGKKELHEDKKDVPEIEIHEIEGKKDKNENMKHSNEDHSESIKIRRKREIGKPPPPPVLPPMDMNMFPSFIRNMISNIPGLRNMLADTAPERPVQDGSSPRTYGFHLNQDKASVFNHLYDMPKYIRDKLNKNDERIEKSTPAYEPDNSDSDTDSDDSDDDDTAGIDDEGDKADADYADKVNDATTPSNVLNNKKPVTKEPNSVTENNKDWNQNKPTTEKNSYLKPKSEKINEKTENINNPISKSRNNVKDNIKDKIETSINKASEVIPPKVKNIERNHSQLSFDGTPKTFGLKLIGDHGYVWNDLSDPGSHYEVGKPSEDKENKHKPEIVKPKPEPKQPDQPKEPIVKENKPDEKDVKTNEVTTEKSAVTENPNKEQKKDDSNNNEAVKDALDNLLKKDEFWQWLTKWTAAYIEVLNENIERLVQKEVAKQIHKISDAKIKKEKAANVTANKDVGGKNQTANNNTTAEPKNGTDKSTPIKANNTETPENKNDTNVPKTSPKLNSHTIYGNAIDSDHVTNIFIFYPNTANETHKALENILNKTNDAVAENPKNSTNENNATTPSSEGTTPNPTEGTTADYLIDKKKDPIPESTTATTTTTSTTTESSPTNNNATQNPNSNVANSAVANSTVANSIVSNSTVENSTVANSNIVNSTVVNSRVVNSTLANKVANNTDVSTETTTSKTEVTSSTATPTSVTPDVSSTTQVSSTTPVSSTAQVSSTTEVSNTNGTTTTTSDNAAKATVSDVTTTPVTPQAT